MASLWRVVVTLCLLAAPARAGTSFVHKKAHSQDLVGVPADVVKLVAGVAAALDGQFRFPRPFRIAVDECGTDSALYSPSAHSLTVCHELWDDSFALFRMAGYDVDGAKRLAKAAVLFALFHELGHALAGEFELADSEDAADELATMFIGQAKDLGKEVAANGLQWLVMMQRDPSHKNAFHDEHALDDDRISRLGCLLYAWDPQGYETLAKLVNVPGHRLAGCLMDETARRTAWDSRLQPHLRTPKR